VLTDPGGAADGAAERDDGVYSNDVATQHDVDGDGGDADRHGGGIW